MSRSKSPSLKFCHAKVERTNTRNSAQPTADRMRLNARSELGSARVCPLSQLYNVSVTSRTYCRRMG